MAKNDIDQATQDYQTTDDVTVDYTTQDGNTQANTTTNNKNKNEGSKKKNNVIIITASVLVALFLGYYLYTDIMSEPAPKKHKIKEQPVASAPVVALPTSSPVVEQNNALEINGNTAPTEVETSQPVTASESSVPVVDNVASSNVATVAPVVAPVVANVAEKAVASIPSNVVSQPIQGNVGNNNNYENRLAALENRINNIEGSMATKDDLKNSVGELKDKIDLLLAKSTNSSNSLNRNVEEHKENKQIVKEKPKYKAKSAVVKNKVKPVKKSSTLPKEVKKEEASKPVVSTPVTPRQEVSMPKIRSNVQLQAMLPDRVWVKNSDGTTSTASVGDKLPNGAKILKIDTNNHKVVTDLGVLE